MQLGLDEDDSVEQLLKDVWLVGGEGGVDLGEGFSDGRVRRERERKSGWQRRCEVKEE